MAETLLGTPLLELRGLRAGYGGVEALHGIDLSVPGGSLTALLGPNGAGKTTTLRVISGLLQPTAGQLLLEGLDLTRPLRVLDACAAPGGKTAHLLELAGAGTPLQVTALEIDPVRSVRIGENLARLGLQAQVLAADAAQPADWWPQHCGGELFDAILLDAPCTASGIVRRHPDVRWLRRESDIDQLAALQARLLRALWPLVKPGGRLLYCTCSVFRAEGDAQVQTFLANNTDAQLLPSPGHLIPTTGDKAGAVPDNSPGDHDGFFYALLQKSPQ